MKISMKNKETKIEVLNEEKLLLRFIQVNLHEHPEKWSLDRGRYTDLDHMEFRHDEKLMRFKIPFQDDCGSPNIRAIIINPAYFRMGFWSSCKIRKAVNIWKKWAKDLEKHENCLSLVESLDLS